MDHTIIHLASGHVIYSPHPVDDVLRHMLTAALPDGSGWYSVGDGIDGKYVQVSHVECIKALGEG